MTPSEAPNHPIYEPAIHAGPLPPAADGPSEVYAWALAAEADMNRLATYQRVLVTYIWKHLGDTGINEAMDLAWKAHYEYSGMASRDLQRRIGKAA